MDINTNRAVQTGPKIHLGDYPGLRAVWPVKDLSEFGDRVFDVHKYVSRMSWRCAGRSVDPRLNADCFALQLARRVSLALFKARHDFGEVAVQVTLAALFPERRFFHQRLLLFQACLVPLRLAHPVQFEQI